MRKPEAAMMRMVLGLTFHDIHGVGARDDRARRRSQRVQVGLGGLRPDEQFGERLAVDIDGYPVGVLGNLHLGAKWHGGREKQTRSRFHVSQYITNGHAEARLRWR